MLTNHAAESPAKTHGESSTKSIRATRRLTDHPVFVEATGISRVGSIGLYDPARLMYSTRSITVRGQVDAGEDVVEHAHLRAQIILLITNNNKSY